VALGGVVVRWFAVISWLMLDVSVVVGMALGGVDD